MPISPRKSGLWAVDKPFLLFRLCFHVIDKSKNNAAVRYEK